MIYYYFTHAFEIFLGEIPIQFCSIDQNNQFSNYVSLDFIRVVLLRLSNQGFQLNDSITSNLVPAVLQTLEETQSTDTASQLRQRRRYAIYLYRACR